MSVFSQRVLWALATLLGVTLFGTGGYMVIEGQGFTDSLFMTVITLTAVGYREVWSLSPEGRLFTMTILLGGITWLGFWFAIVTSLIVEMDLRGALRTRREIKEIKKMRDHVIVCGAGRTGRQVAKELDAAGADYIVVEWDSEQVEWIRENLRSAHVIEGDATHDQVLLEAGITHAKGLITCLSADADNLYVCLSARDLVATVTIVARATDEDSIAKMYRAGADQVVSPNISSASRMASVVLRPSVVSLVDIATRSEHVELRMEQVGVEDGARVAGLPLADARIPEETGLLVIAVRKAGAGTNGFVFNPSADTRLDPGDEVIVLGSPEQLDRLGDLLT